MANSASLPSAGENRSVVGRIGELARCYTPEWRFTPDRPDAGTAAALLIGRMLQDSGQRLDQVLHKHHLQYMNLFEGIVAEPLESAKSFVRFTPVAGAASPVHVPKGTRLNAAGAGEHLQFETLHGITAVNASLMDIYACDRSRDAIVRLAPGEDGDAEHVSFTAFDTTGKNENEHLLLMWFEDVFDELDALELSLSLETGAKGDPEQAAQALGGEGMHFFVLGEEGEAPFDKVYSEGNVLHLTKEDYRPFRQAYGAGQEGFLIGVRADAPNPVQIASVRLHMAQENLLADFVTCQGVSQNIGHFLPFGAPMEIYAECGIENARVFSKKGAQITMTFDLGFEVVRERLPEYEESTEYKIVMKKPQQLPRPVESEVRADSVLLEYWSRRGWRRIGAGEHETLLWNGSSSGEVSISFRCPDDMVSSQEAGGQPRLRLRLMKAENLYHVPCVQYCPVMDNLRFSYTFGEEGRLPERACTRNLFETVEITGRLKDGLATTLFYNNEVEHPAMYLGFDAMPEGSPLSLYWLLESNADRPLEFMAEYETEEGFLPIKVVDGTGGMLYSGAMLMVVPGDGVRRERFGRERYWLRLQNLSAGDRELPRVSGIYLNMARVENVITRTEHFYLDDLDAPLRIQLGEKHFIRVHVWVREEDTDSGEAKWVPWEVRQWAQESPQSRQQRVCQVDLEQGVLSFSRSVFSAFPVSREGPAIRVEYQSYQGADANVGAGEICVLSDSVRFISRASNPFAAYGGHDSGSERGTDALIGAVLRTRRRAVSGQDLLDMVRQVTGGARRIKCCRGVNRHGDPQADAVTVALLIDEYAKGSHIFSAMREEIQRKLEESSIFPLLGGKLALIQPHFVEISVRLWIACPDLEDLYDLQRQTVEHIRRFLDPLEGNFDGKGWEIGVLPSVSKLLAVLKLRLPEVTVTRILETARFDGREYAVEGDVADVVRNPFAIAVNGEHRVYVQT